MSLDTEDTAVGTREDEPLSIISDTRLVPAQWRVHLGLIGSILLMASPLLLAFVMSTQTVPEVYDITNVGIGSDGLANYVEVFTTYGMASYMFNSLVMSIVVTVAKIAVSLLAAVALVFYDFRFKNAIFFLILFTLMFPVPVRIVPLYEMMAALGWTNTLLALTGPYVASATAVFLLRQHFMSIPDSLVESAKVDGVGPLRFLWDVLIPMSRGMISGLSVITFIYAWNQYLWPLIVISDQNKQVVQVGMKYLQSVGNAGQTDWGLIMAGAVLTLLPPLLALIVFRGPLLETFGLSE
ncbi:glycerol-3-phosphate ABC transporter permease [Halorubrum sp. Ea1]|nr:MULTISPECIES: carbohydrate ABC transporter permease [unclassified Halorubrum]OYR43624.1 glycerol-3-phosphate ABC transporter permease [Halorubrum sp. Hd13]OYR44011.1 glycerol-3-phosphate ABC transporter permease [Halorubrum sp. Eb13]OYR52363.1 glycerol-3-phosphate ABC transporter permease [Halorubrum sp. Ea8]OYR56103.1 glycerol-3-phosphate ABC transporter permease [Halorubrum sp. Ea1]